MHSLDIYVCTVVGWVQEFLFVPWRLSEKIDKDPEGPEGPEGELFVIIRLKQRAKGRWI